MARIWKLWAVAAGLVGLGVLALVWWESAPKRELVSTCEELVQGPLRSPSTYHRVAVTVEFSDTTYSRSYEQALWSRNHSDSMHSNSFARYIEALQRRQRSEGQKITELKIYLANVRVEYDASNAFGIPIRGVHACLFYQTNTQQPRKWYGQILVSDQELR